MDSINNRYNIKYFFFIISKKNITYYYIWLFLIKYIESITSVNKKEKKLLVSKEGYPKEFN
jgi:hypothetical protein